MIIAFQAHIRVSLFHFYFFNAHTIHDNVMLAAAAATVLWCIKVDLIDTVQFFVN